MSLAPVFAPAYLECRSEIGTGSVTSELGTGGELKLCQVATNMLVLYRCK